MVGVEGCGVSRQENHPEKSGRADRYEDVPRLVEVFRKAPTHGKAEHI